MLRRAYSLQGNSLLIRYSGLDDEEKPWAQHPNIHSYRDGGLGGASPEDHNVVGYVPTHALLGMPGNRTDRERVDHYRKKIRSGQGFDDPIMVDHDPKTKYTMIGEGNHRLKAAHEEGLSHVPVRVTKTRIDGDEKWEDGGHPKKVDPGPSPWKGNLGEEYWPPDTHPKHLFKDHDVLDGPPHVQKTSAANQALEAYFYSETNARQAKDALANYYRVIGPETTEPYQGRPYRLSISIPSQDALSTLVVSAPIASKIIELVNRYMGVVADPS